VLYGAERNEKSLETNDSQAFRYLRKGSTVSTNTMALTALHWAAHWVKAFDARPESGRDGPVAL